MGKLQIFFSTDSNYKRTYYYHDQWYNDLYGSKTDGIAYWEFIFNENIGSITNYYIKNTINYTSRTSTPFGVDTTSGVIIDTIKITDLGNGKN